MRMVYALNETTSEGAMAVKQTGIGGDSKIVYALLTGMVKDKVEYPVREYATNAWEVSPAGKPFEIQLPTRLDPQYGIRDFGPGLSHKFMMDRYAKIGESTKDGDDDAVGGWGFGSKAALAYLMRSDGSGSFTVISRHKGFRRIYVIGVSEQGKIQIQFMGEWPLDADDRGTGLEISFAVREDDVHRFTNHAREILWSFHPRPRITPAIDFGTPKILHQGDGWVLYDPHTVPFSGPQVQLGPVMYAIDTDLMPDSPLVAENTTIVFQAKIGSISVSASREDLQYDDRTSLGLRALFEHYRHDWMVKAQIALDAQPTYFKARWLAQDLSATIPRQNYGWGIIKGLSWRGFSFHESLFPNDLLVKAARWPEMMPSNRMAGTPLSFRAEWNISPSILEDRKIVIQHNTSRSLDRLALAGLTNEKFLWIRCKRVDLDDVLARIGRPEYILLDDYKPAALPRGPKGERVVRPATERRTKLFNPASGFSSVEWVDHAEEQVWMRMYGRGRKQRHEFDVAGDSRDYRCGQSDSLMNTLDSLKSCGYQFADDFNVVVLGEYDDVPDHWISLGDHLVEIIDERIDPTQVRPTVAWSYNTFPQTLRTLRDGPITFDKAPPVIADLFQQVTDLLATRETFLRPDTDHDRLAAINLRLTGTDLKSVVKDPTQPVRDAWAVFMNGAPLLPLMINELLNWTYRNSSNAYKLEVQSQFDHYFELLTK